MEPLAPRHPEFLGTVGHCGVGCGSGRAHHPKDLRAYCSRPRRPPHPHQPPGTFCSHRSPWASDGRRRSAGPTPCPACLTAPAGFAKRGRSDSDDAQEPAAGWREKPRKTRGRGVSQIPRDRPESSGDESRPVLDLLFLNHDWRFYTQFRIARVRTVDPLRSPTPPTDRQQQKRAPGQRAPDTQFRYCDERHVHRPVPLRRVE